MKKPKKTSPHLHIRLDDDGKERADMDAAASQEKDDRGRPLKTSTWARRVLLAAARGER